jgi:hypothetical protein
VGKGVRLPFRAHPRTVVGRRWRVGHEAVGSPRDLGKGASKGERFERQTRRGLKRTTKTPPGVEEGAQGPRGLRGRGAAYIWPAFKGKGPYRECRLGGLVAFCANGV